MTLKRNKVDLLIISLSLVFVIVLVILSNIVTGSVKGGEKYVVISIEGKEKYKYKLNEDKTIELKQSEYSSLLGDMTIEIKDNRVRVAKEKSPKNYCSKQGWVSSVATPIVCLPNKVVVTILGHQDNDVDIMMDRQISFTEVL